jgi:hypothetical protein
VGGDRGGDEWVRDLEEERSATAEQDRGFAVDPPRDRVRTEETRDGIDSSAATRRSQAMQLLPGKTHAHPGI